jgi:hypothetical protein
VVSAQDALVPIFGFLIFSSASCSGLRLRLDLVDGALDPGIARSDRRETNAASDVDCGICFEYAVHDALNRNESSVTERVHEAMKVLCGVPGSSPASILFGLEKKGALNLIDTVKERLTEASWSE